MTGGVTFGRRKRETTKFLKIVAGIVLGVVIASSVAVVILNLPKKQNEKEVEFIEEVSSPVGKKKGDKK